MGKPHISVGALGGTVAMTSRAPGEGVTPGLGAHDLVASVPGLEAHARLRAETVLQLPSAALGFDDLLRCLAWAEVEVEQGAAGVVLTQGTDTLEETAFLLDLFWRRPEPLVLTGAMRAPQQAGADGPANLLAAVIVAAAASSRARGVQVVMNDVVHEARWVRKGHALAVDAFVSPVAGPAGVVVEQRVAYLRGAPVRVNCPVPTATTAKVPLVEAVLGDDLEVLDWLAANGAAALVIAGFGAGHVSFGAAQRIEQHAARIPVVIASRTGAGPTASSTYGFVGSERDLARRGALLAGWLDARKTRLLLWALMAAGTPRAGIAEKLAAFNP